MVVFVQNQFPAVYSSCVFQDDWPDTDYPSYAWLLGLDPCFGPARSDDTQHVAVLMEKLDVVRFHQLSSHAGFG